MKETKLIKICKTFSEEEWKYLRWFVNSNYFNTDSNLYALYEAISKYYPNFDANHLTKEVVYTKVFEAQIFHDRKWRNLLSKMTKLVEDYLILLELEHETHEKKKLLASSFGRRNLYEFFEKTSFELSKELGEQANLNLTSYKSRAEISMNFYHHPKTPKINHIALLESAMNDIDVYYFSEKLRLACEFKVYENMLSNTTTIRLKEEIKHQLNVGKLKKPAYLTLYQNILEQLESPKDLSTFQKTFEYFVSNGRQLSHENKQFALLHLLNFAINQFNSGKVEYRNMTMNLYKYGLEHSLLFTDNKLSEGSFTNIVSTSLGLKEFEWAANFIEKFEKHLPEEIRITTKTLCLGHWHFHKGEFAQTIDYLNNFQFKDFKMAITSKNLLLRCYFEMFCADSSYYSLFISFANAFEKFIQREKQLAVNRKNWYKTLIHILTKIARHKAEHSWSTEIKNKILTDISENPMYLKAWLIERLQRLN